MTMSPDAGTRAARSGTWCVGAGLLAPLGDQPGLGIVPGRGTEMLPVGCFAPRPRLASPRFGLQPLGQDIDRHVV